MRQLWLGGEGEAGTTPEQEPISMVGGGCGCRGEMIIEHIDELEY
jgi:hypothetical protein